MDNDNPMKRKITLLATSLLLPTAHAAKSVDVEHSKSLLSKQFPSLVWGSNDTAQSSNLNTYKVDKHGVSVFAKMYGKDQEELFASIDTSIDDCANVASTIAGHPNDTKIKEGVRQLVIQSFSQLGESYYGQIYDYEFSAFTLDMATNYALTCTIYKK